jgi:hypothetical protein
MYKLKYKLHRVRSQLEEATTLVKEKMGHLSVSKGKWKEQKELHLNQ